MVNKKLAIGGFVAVTLLAGCTAVVEKIVEKPVYIAIPSTFLN